MNKNNNVKTRVSVWGVLLAPVWLFLKMCIGIGYFLGNICSNITRWVANICFFLDILVWITCGFQMFLLVLIPIAFLWAFPYIWGFAFGILDTMCDGISYLWHIPVVEKTDNKQNYDNYNNNINNQNNQSYNSPNNSYSNVNNSYNNINNNDNKGYTDGYNQGYLDGLRASNGNNIDNSNNTPDLLSISNSKSNEDNFIPEGYEEFVKETEAFNNYKPDKIED